MRKLVLQRDDLCRVCARPLEQGTEAWWDAQRRAATCLDCYENAVSTAAASIDLQADRDRGEAGDSARAEAARRRRRREERLHDTHPKLGRVILWAGQQPLSTRAPDQGAEGEEAVGAVLDDARSQGIEVLHDRRIPRSPANIDHLVVAPNGIWVVDTERYKEQKLGQRFGFFRREARLFVGGRDKTAMADAVTKQADRVRGALIGTDFEAVPVFGALCFVGAYPGWFARPFKVRGVTVTWRKHLVAPMLVELTLDETQRRAIAAHLATVFAAK